MARRVLVDLDEGVTETMCEGRRGCCRFAYGYDGKTGWSCGVFGDRQLEHDKRTSWCKRLPECLAAEQAARGQAQGKERG